MHLNNSHINSVLQFLVVFCTTINIINAQISEDEKQSLLDVYEHMGGENWKNTWNLEEKAANWYGVKLKDSKVIELNLFNNNLVGVLPESI